MNDFEKQLAQQQFKPVPPEWRAAVLRAAEQPAPVGGAKNERSMPWWQMLLWPSPRTCLGLAAVWVLIILGHLTMPSVNSSPTLPTLAVGATAAEAWREQQQLLAELFPQEHRVEPPKALPPRRRTERDSGCYFA